MCSSTLLKQAGRVFNVIKVQREFGRVDFEDSMVGREGQTV